MFYFSYLEGTDFVPWEVKILEIDVRIQAMTSEIKKVKY